MAFQKNHIPWNKGQSILLNTGRTHFKKGFVPWNKDKAIFGICIDCKGKTSKWNNRDKAKRCKACYIKHYFKIQENHPRWKGGVTSEKHKLRGKQEWRNWREAIFERDNYTCQECGINKTYLEPHHIIPIRSDKDRVHDITNGITLCRPCHLKTIWKESNFEQKYSALVVAH